MPKEIFTLVDKNENPNNNSEENAEQEPEDPKEIAAKMIEDLYYPKAGEMKEERKENMIKEILERVKNFKKDAEQKVKRLNSNINYNEKELERSALNRMFIPKRVFENDISRFEEIKELTESKIEKYDKVEQDVEGKEFEVAIKPLEEVITDLLKENRILDSMSMFEFTVLFNTGGTATGDSIYENEREVRQINQLIGQLEKLIEEK